VGPITSIVALRLCGCFRLAARIYELRKMGFHIITTFVLNDYGNPYGEYNLINGPLDEWRK